MATFQTEVSKPTVYRVQRSSNESLGVGWLYNWKVESTLNPLDNGFYIIEGVIKDQETTTWTTQPFVTIIFTRPTLEGEEFTIKVKIKILSGNSEVCEELTLDTITVIPDPNSVLCNTLSTTTSCIVAGTDYLYTLCCNQYQPLNEVIFNVDNARVFNLNGVEYQSSKNISVKSFTNNCASIVVRWNNTDPISPGYKISAYGIRNQKFSNIVSLSDIYAIPPTPNISIISDDAFAYNSGANEIKLRLSKLTRYPDNYKIIIKKRDRFTTNDIDWSTWSTLYTGFVVDLRPSYSYDVTSVLNLNTPYYTNAPEFYQIEFEVKIYECSDEGTCDTDLNCYTSNTIAKTIELTHCPIEIPFGDLQTLINVCTTDITLGDITWTKKFCYDTYWYTDNTCKIHCFDSYWYTDSTCKIHCFDTYWYTDSTCKIHCFDTYWYTDKHCKIICFDTYWQYDSYCRIICFDTIWDLTYICRRFCIVPIYTLVPCWFTEITIVPSTWKVYRVQTKSAFITRP